MTNRIENQPRSPVQHIIFSEDAEASSLLPKNDKVSAPSKPGAQVAVEIIEGRVITAGNEPEALKREKNRERIAREKNLNTPRRVTSNT